MHDTNRRADDVDEPSRSSASDDPYRRLAIRVVARAVLDVTGVGGSATDRESARVFLAGSIMLSHWCHVAALDPAWVVSRAERLGRGSQ